MRSICHVAPILWDAKQIEAFRKAHTVLFSILTLFLVKMTQPFLARIRIAFWLLNHTLTFLLVNSLSAYCCYHLTSAMKPRETCYIAPTQLYKLVMHYLSSEGLSFKKSSLKCIFSKYHSFCNSCHYLDMYDQDEKCAFTLPVKSTLLLLFRSATTVRSFRPNSFLWWQYLIIFWAINLF